MQYVILQLPISFCQNLIVNLYCVDINFFSFVLFLHSLLPLSFSFCFFPFVLCSVIFLTLQLFTSPFPPALSLPFHHLSPLPPASISPPGAGPQLCGVPVLLPTWAERLFPPGPPPGANDRAVPGQHQPLPHIQPQQQVGRATTARNNDYESRWALTTPWFQKCGLQSWLC